MSLIEVKGLKTYFHTEGGVVRAVDGVDFTIQPRRTLGVVGESGCGKSVTAQSIMRLVKMPPGRIEAGEILYHRKGQMIDLAQVKPMGPLMRSIRGNEIAMIFQEPMTSLNPVYSIGNQIIETITHHRGLKKREARDIALEMLRAVGIPSPEQRIDEYPHQLSGGMRQRAMVAMAMSCHPFLLIADEPTTALDVTIQAQVLKLMNDLRRDFNTAILFITHDLGVIAHMADEVAVMYLGKIVESGSVKDIFGDPRHPYTQGLIKSIPSLTGRKGGRLIPIEGTVPEPFDVPRGCGFAPRCSQCKTDCRFEMPGLREVAPGHSVACWLS